MKEYQEVEDPPEPVKTALYAFNERDPLHKLEETFDTKHMIAHANWGILFTMEEFWSYKTPFKAEIKEENHENELEYEEDYEVLGYELSMNIASIYFSNRNFISNEGYTSFERLTSELNVEKNDILEEESQVQPTKEIEIQEEPMQINESRVEKEDFLEEIYRIIEKHRKNIIKQEDIGNLLNTPNHDISKLVEKLTKEGLMQNSLSGLKLTKKGINEARIITKRHRVIEVFLKQDKHNKKTIHKKAHYLEHKFNDEVIERLDSMLGYPKYCPHGKSIPRIKMLK